VRYAIEYESRAVFAEPVREQHCELRVAPREDRHQKVVVQRVATEPESAVASYLCAFGNRVHYFDLTLPHTELTVHLRAEVETGLDNPFAFTPVPPGRERAWLDSEIKREPRLLDFILHHSQHTPRCDGIGALAAAPAYDGKDWLLESVVAARDWVAKQLEFAPHPAGEERRPLEEVLERGQGDGRDMAHAVIAVIRSWRVPARFVAGYQDVSDDADDNPAHAWAEVLIPGAGWRGFDPVYGMIANDRYVTVAVGRDAADTPSWRTAFKGEESPEAPIIRLQMSRQEQ